MMPRIQLAHLMFRLQVLRLRAERALAALRPWRRAPRVIATACWNFPIYSQTFVYPELTQLVRNGCSLRFLYGNLNRADPLPPQFRAVWRARRRLVLEPSVCDHCYADFQCRMPPRVAALIAMLAGASALTADEIRSLYPVLQAFVKARLVEAFRPDY